VATTEQYTQKVADTARAATGMSNERINLRGLLPKIRQLPGSVHAESKRCGKQACRCKRGQLHGPYWYRHWREHGRQRKAYVGSAEIAATHEAIAAWRRLRPPAWTLRRELAELRRMERAVTTSEE
jgi:hypothetical protein